MASDNFSDQSTTRNSKSRCPWRHEECIIKDHSLIKLYSFKCGIHDTIEYIIKNQRFFWILLIDE